MRILWLVFILCLLYYAVGLFPIVPVEGDDLGIVNGVLQIANDGLASRDLAYRYEAQSGSYAFVLLLHKLFGFEPLFAFGLLSGAASIAFIVLSAWLVSRLSGFPAPLCGIVLLLFQEATTGGYYANTTAIAAVFAVTALLIMTFEKHVWALVTAGVLFGTAAWMRLDALLITPATLLVLYQGNWKQTMYRTAVVAAAAGLVTLTGVYGGSSSIDEILKISETHLSTSSLGTSGLGLPLIGNANVKSLISYFSALLTVLFLAGMVKSFRSHNFKVPGLFALAAVPFYLYYGGIIVSPKYMYYLLPFFLLIVLQAFPRQFPEAFSPALTAAIVGLFLAQYVVGLRANFANKPYVATPYPTLVTLGKLEIGGKNVENGALVIGSGSVVTTDDSYRLSSGLIFSPLLWRHHKSIRDRELGAIKDYFENSAERHRHFLTTAWVSHQVVIYLLLKSGYRLEKVAGEDIYETMRWRCGNRIVTLTTAYTTDLDQERLSAVFSQMESGRFTYVISLGRDEKALTESAAKWRKILGHQDIDMLAVYEVELLGN